MFPSAAGAVGIAGRIEAGAEYDSNPTRIETYAGETEGAPTRTRLPSPALRLALSADLDEALSDRWALSLGGAVAGRRLLEPGAQGEDLLVSEGRASLNALLAPGWALGAHAALYDVGQRADSVEEARDFRSIAPGARLLAPAGGGRVSLAAGWRWFQFKPARSLDFAGPTLALAYRHTTSFSLDGAAEWDWGLGGGLEVRRFASDVKTSCSDPDVCGMDTSWRRDGFFTLDADVTRTGDQLVGAGVSLQSNRSNTLGQSLGRLALHARLVWLLPLDLSFAARGELVFTRYDDAVAVGQNVTTGAFVTIEEEGRSSVRLDLSHPLGNHVELGVRFTWYAQAPGSSVHFGRALWLGYLALGLGR